ncbi:secreted lipase [Penicillium expansum]|nr:secreted lipase [Penicillium expansum]
MGVIQNNGTVQSRKGIPYAEPPLGELRFELPRVLAPQSLNVVNTTTAPDRCVQFTLAPYGVHNAYLGPGSPGTEDCLKLFVWKPARARQNAKLPVMGGGLVFGEELQDDYGDWVGHDQKFIAVNMNYRLGMLGFMNHPDLPSANAGLLDQRMAMRWVKQNIAAFGGDPDNITIISQSGSGWAIAAQLGLYDCQTNGTFQRAIARSIQREPLFTTKELMLRNTVLSEQLNCTSADQLACFRSVSVPDLVDIFQNMSIANGTECIFADKVFGYQASFGPTIDGVTLTDSVTRLFKNGKTANVPTIAGCVSDEGYDGWIDAYQMNPTLKNTTQLDPSTNRITNLTDAEVYEVASFYPVSAGYGAVAPDNFLLDVFKSYWMALGLFGEVGIFGSERMMGPWLSAAHGSKHIWTFRCNAPPVGASFNGSYPLAPVTHSFENTYLNNPLSTMADYERAVAVEFRAYLSSFIRTGNPNTHKVATAPHWPHYGALGDFVNSPVRLVPQFAFETNANKSYPTSTQLKFAKKRVLSGPISGSRTECWTRRDFKSTASPTMAIDKWLHYSSEV